MDDGSMRYRVFLPSEVVCSTSRVRSRCCDLRWGPRLSAARRLPRMSEMDDGSVWCCVFLPSESCISAIRGSLFFRCPERGFQLFAGMRSALDYDLHAHQGCSSTMAVSFKDLYGDLYWAGMTGDTLVALALDVPFLTTGGGMLVDHHVATFVARAAVPLDLVELARLLLPYFPLSCSSSTAPCSPACWV